MKKFHSLLLSGLLATAGCLTGSAQTAKTVPYSSPITISSSAFDEGWTQIDADGNGCKWGPYYTSAASIGGTGSCAASQGSQKNLKDDWLISPPIQLEANKEYRVFYGIKAESSSHPQDLTVYLTTSNEPEVIKTSTPIDSYEGYTNTTFTKIDKTFNCSESGNYYLTFNCTSIADNYYMMVAVAEIFENEFTPKGVSDLKAERNADRNVVSVDLSWTLPTQSVFGEDFTEDQTVEKVYIYRDGSAEPIKTFEGAATEFTDDETTGLTPGIHTYEVAVVVAGRSSGKASATTKYVGPVTPEAVPYTWTITDQDAFEDWTSLVGDNADNKSLWSYYSYGPYGRFSSSKDQKEENYFIAPPFAVSEPGYYLVTVNALIGNTSYNTTNILQVRYGTEPDIASMSNIICEKMDLTSNSKAPYSYAVKLDAPGTYYFGVVAASEIPQGTTFGVYSIGVEETEKTPAAVTDLVATPGENDALTVTLSWTCPAKSSDGGDLDASEYKIEIYKGENLLTTLDGGISTYTETVPEPGVYTYSVKTVAAAGGASVGAVTVTSKWVGPHLVALPYSTEFKPADTTVAIWEVVDANNDGNTWHYYSNSYRCKQSNQPGEAPKTWIYEDYFLSPWFDMTPGYYCLDFMPLGGSGSAPMTHKVGFVEAGTFVADRSELQQPAEFESTNPGTFYAKMEKYIFKIEEAGQYQLVFAAVGEQPEQSNTTDSYYMYGFTNVTVDAYPVLPEVATNLTATAAEDEILEVTLSWTNPTATSVENVELDVITKAVIIRDGKEAATVEEGLVPGETASFVDSAATGLTSGPHTYSVEIYNASGKSKNAAPTAQVRWVGGALDIPNDEAGVTHGYAEFDEYWEFIDVDGNQKSSYDGWSISGTTAMKVDETNYDDEYDDWAISPRFNIKKGYCYEITFETYLGASYKDYTAYPLDVYVGGGDNYKSYKYVGTVTSSVANANATSPEVHKLYIYGDETLANNIMALDAEDTEHPTQKSVTPGSNAIALWAHTEGGVFVKTFNIKVHEAAPEEPETPAIPEDAYVVYANGVVDSDLHLYNWWNASYNFEAENPAGEGLVYEFKANDGSAAASMGLNMEKPQNTGKLHDATLNFSWYANTSATYTIRLTSSNEFNYTFTPAEDELNKWNTLSLSLSEFKNADPSLSIAQQWNDNANFGEGYVFSVVLANGQEESVIYFNNIYYTNVDEEWEAPEVVIPAPETVPVPEHDAENVISVYGSTYKPATTWNHGGWGQSTQISEVDIDDQKVEWFRNFNYEGWELKSDLNVSDYDYMHVDMWTDAEGKNFGITPITRAGDKTEDSKVQSVVANEWNSYDLPLAEWAAIGMDLSQVFQIKFDQGNGYDCYVTNVYFWKSETPVEPVVKYYIKNADQQTFEMTLDEDTNILTAKEVEFNPQTFHIEKHENGVRVEWYGAASNENAAHEITSYKDYNGAVNSEIDWVRSGAVDNVCDFKYDLTNHVLTVAQAGTLSVGGINADDADVRYFDINGFEIKNPRAGQMLIKVSNGKATKVLVK